MNNKHNSEIDNNIKPYNPTIHDSNAEIISQAFSLTKYTIGCIFAYYTLKLIENAITQYNFEIDYSKENGTLKTNFKKDGTTFSN